MTEEAEPRIGVPYDATGEGVFLNEKMAALALQFGVRALVERLHHGGMAIVALEDYRMIVRFFQSSIRTSNVAFAAIMNQWMQADLMQVTIHKQRFVSGMASNTGRIRVFNPDKLVVLLPVHLRERAGTRIQYAVAHQAIRLGIGTKHRHIRILDMRPSDPVAGLAFNR